MLFAGVMLWSLGTLIAPLCAQFSFTALLASRFLVGLGEGVAPSAATGVLARGIPGSQRSKAVTATFGGLDVGSLSGLIIAPPIILYLGGWPAVFYLFGVLGFLWGTWWFIAYMRDSSTANEKSVDMKETAAETAKAAGGLNIPWGKFAKSKEFWALMVAHFTWNYFSYGLLAWLPSFLSSALERHSQQILVPVHLAVPRHRRGDHIVAPTAENSRRTACSARTSTECPKTLCFGGGAVCLTRLAWVINSTPPEAVTKTTIAPS